MTSLLLAAAITLSQPTDTVGFGSLGTQIRNTTSMNSTLNELNLVLDFMSNAQFSEPYTLQDGEKIVIYHNNLDYTLRDTVLIREPSELAGYLYKLYYKPQDN